MIRSFADETTRDLFGNVNSKSARRLPNTAWRAVQRKLKQLDLVTRLDDLQIPPDSDLNALKGNEAGRHAIKLNDQYRITFRWEGQDACDVCCEDYLITVTYFQAAIRCSARCIRVRRAARSRRVKVHWNGVAARV